MDSRFIVNWNDIRIINIGEKKIKEFDLVMKNVAPSSKDDFKVTNYESVTLNSVNNEVQIIKVIKHITYDN